MQTTKMIPTRLVIVQHNVQHWISNKACLINTYLQNNPDIILINSHGCRKNDSIKIPGYNIYTTNTTNELHNGTAIAIKRTLEYRITDDYMSDTLSTTIKTQTGDVEFATSYIPPRIGFINSIDFYRLFKKNHPVYFLGDLNARHQFLGYGNSNTSGRQIVKMIDRKLIRHVGPDFSTFINHRSTTSPDIILTNSKTYHNTFTETGPPTSSDHIPIIFTISLNPIMKEIPARINFKKANWQGYKEELKRHPYTQTPLILPQEIDKALLNWTKSVKKASANNIPYTKYRSIPHFKTDHNTRMIRIQHDTLLDEIRLYGPNLNRQKRLCKLRRELSDHYKRLNNEEWDKLTQRTDKERNSKDFWVSIKRMFGRQSKQDTRYLKDNNNNDIYDDAGKEQIFRKHWSKVFNIDTVENSQFNPVTDLLVEEYISNNQEHLIPLSNCNSINNIVSLSEVKYQISTFKQRAAGEDGITKYHLTNLPLNMLQELTKIINSALTIGYFPKHWKNAIVIFLPKPGKSPLHHTNYRPISLLSVPGKLFEKVINRYLINAIDENNLNNTAQHGFRKNRGTDTAIAILYETIAIAKANNKKVNIVLRDISKAFDKVWHNGLLYKLLNSEIPPFITRIIASYLKDRTSQIRIGRHTGSKFPNKTGVPQGGCLSPILFNFYTHDLPPPQHNSDQIIYADDISQIITYKGSENFLKAHTQREIERINIFENNWKIKTNMDKFQVLAIGRKNKLQVNIDGQAIPFSNEGKILGIQITNNGFLKHAKTRHNIAKQKMKKLYRFKNLSENNKRLLYLTTVRPILEYSPVPLHTRSKTAITKLQRVQNQATRFITNSSRSDKFTSQLLHQKSNLPPLNTVLHNRAKDIWQRIENNYIITQEIENRLTIERGRAAPQNYQSSRIKCQEQAIPIYS